MSFKISTFGLGNSGINGGLDFVDRHFGQSHPFTKMGSGWKAHDFSSAL